MHFGWDLGAKIEEKSMQKRCQKHVGIDLEAQVAKTQKLTPLIPFFGVFSSEVGSQIHKKSKRNRPQQ